MSLNKVFYSLMLKNNRSMNQKRISKLAFYPLLLLALFNGCSKQGAESNRFKALDKTPEPVEINFIGHWLNEGERENFVRNIAREYEFENQHVKINLKFPEEVYYDQMDRKSNEKFTARVVDEGITDWDIIRINGEFREVYDILKDKDWAKKNLVDFSQYEEFSEGTLPQLLTEEAKADWNGIVPGPYVEGQYWALWCNRKVAEKVGIEVKQFGMTFDDFLSYAKAVDDYNRKNPDDHIVTLFESYVWETTQALGISLYASLMDSAEEFKSLKITEKRLAAWEQTLQALEQLSAYAPIDPSWRETEWTETQKDFLEEKYLFYINGSWMYNIWKGIDDQKIQHVMPAEFPGFKQHVIYPAAYQVTWGVLKNSPNREEAVKFLMAMNKPEIAEMWSRYTKCPTGIKGNLASTSFGGDQFENFSNYVQTEFGSNIYRYYESARWMLNDAHAGDNMYFRDVIEGKITAREAMRRIRSQIGR